MAGVGGLRLSVQGMDRNYRYVGSYDEVEIGSVTLDYVERVVDHVASLRYPPNYDRDDLCPAALFVEKWGATLCIYYNGDGTFMVRIIDEASSSDTFITEDAGAEQVKGYLRRFAGSREGVEEMLGPEAKREYIVNVSKQFWVDGHVDRPVAMEVSRNSVFGVEPDRIVSAIVTKGGVLSKPTVKIRYWDKRGNVAEARFILPSRGEAERAYKLLNIFLPGRVQMR